MRYLLALMLLLTAVNAARADRNSSGNNGARARGLTLPDGVPLDGTGVGIGQVEHARPGKPDQDTNPDDHNTAVKPAKVFGSVIHFNDDHATQVASVMIADESLGAAYVGIAPKASLHAVGYLPYSSNWHQDPMIESMRIINDTTLPKVRAINMSFGFSLTEFDVPDGNSEVSQFVDWSASKHDVLYVIGGNVNYTIGPAPSPADNFNGITVAASNTGFSGNVWRQISGFNRYDEVVDAFGDRVSVDILAPGEQLTTLTSDDDEPYPNSRGTSLAAPHVTGAVSLLHQYGNYQVTNNPGFYWKEPNAHRHEVMKAVLLNSADKIEDVHGSPRTVRTADNRTWVDSPANFDIAMPLDLEMGAGHLNVSNALKQYRTGEWDVGTIGTVPNIGWDYGTVYADEAVRYVFNQSLSSGSVVAATLCWDRRVETISPNSNNYLDGFFDYVDISEVLNDLDIYLQPAFADPDDLESVIWASVSSVDNVEHIFFQIPQGAGGQYQLTVKHAGYGPGDAQNYGVAWWAGDALSGDFDGDGDVDNDDLDDWKLGFGPENQTGDADNDGDSDGADFLAWQRNYGTGVPPITAVPEPSSCSLGCFGFLLLWRRRCMAALSAAAIVATASPANAATTTFTRQSRPATPAEISDGVPSGSMVHDFFATTDADILCLATSFHSPVFKHRYGNDYSPPEQELVSMFPALGATSYLDTPGGTFTLGGNLSTDAEKAWADLSDDGPQEDFLFGRLTTVEIGTFSGWLALRGETTYIEMPFSFTLVDEQGPLYEELTVFGEEPEIPVYIPTPEPTTPVEFPKPVIVPTFTPPLDGVKATLEAKRDRIREYKLTGVLPQAPARSWPLKEAVKQMSEPAAWLLAQVSQPDFDPQEAVTIESESPPPIDNPLDVTGMRAVYDPLTGNVEFEGLTNIHGVGVMGSGDVEVNPSGALSAGDFMVANAEEIGWLFMSGIAGGAFYGGTILEPGLSDELSNYFIGVSSMGSGKSVTPIPIVSGSTSYLPNFNPFAPASVASVPEPSALMLGVLGLAALCRLRISRSARK